LASTQDLNIWNDRVMDRRHEFAGPHVVFPLIHRFIEIGALPEPKSDDYEIRWPQIENLDDMEKAEVAVKWAQINEKAGETVVSPDEIRDKVLGMPSRKAAGVEVKPVGVARPDSEQSPSPRPIRRAAGA
jgi:hypothetical protein